MKNASVRFYFDADILGLAHIVCSLRPDCTFPGDPGRTIKRQARPPCEIAQGAKDSDWIPAVAERGWLAITRDANIQSHLSLLQLVQEHRLRLVVGRPKSRACFDLRFGSVGRWPAFGDPMTNGLPVPQRVMGQSYACGGRLLRTAKPAKYLALTCMDTAGNDNSLSDRPYCGGR